MDSSAIRHWHATQLFHAVRLNPDSSQRKLAEITACDKSTVSVIINGFEEAGLVVRAQTSRLRGPGRPTEAIRLSRTGGFLVGVHVQPESLRFVGAWLDGVPIDYIDTAGPDHPDHLAGAVERGIGDLAARLSWRPRDIRAVGVCIPGLLASTGGLMHSPNLKWHDVAVSDLLREGLNWPVYVSNDAKADTMAEHLFGRCIGVNDFIYAGSNSGFGGGLFLNGRLYGGAFGLAGEIGHTKVVPNGRLCSCGGAGCLSAYLSVPSLLARAGQRGHAMISFQEFARLAERGDPLVMDIIEEAGALLGLGLANIVNLFNPPVVVLGGALATLADHLLPHVTRALRAQALGPMLSQTKILLSELGAHRPYLGGIAMALEGFTQFGLTGFNGAADNKRPAAVPGAAVARSSGGRSNILHQAQR